MSIMSFNILNTECPKMSLKGDLVAMNNIWICCFIGRNQFTRYL